MKVTVYIEDKIKRLPRGYVFTYEWFDIDVRKKQALIKALNRMVDAKKLSKLSKGRYFKPETTPFGNLQPSQEQVVKDLLYNNGKIVGYFTGYSIYNKLGLTSQVSNSIQIGKNEIRPEFKRERYTISFVKQKNVITKKNIPLLQILDAIRYIKKIPDTTIEISCLRLLEIIKSLNDDNKKDLVRLSLKYPPSTRALLGALLEELQEGSITEILRKSLNSITQYKIPEVTKVLTKSSGWNIV
ncbi:MAG: hypothetical protein CSA95_03330 [Bacteroidetes bacterium]|nr:MAG: hypothetical protein CSA95_03330 [Bacteroidota bacterium]PIE87637.1 MAG: hypothetical protein CSA04_06005 [Bacteroidota bacterium]